MNYHVLKEIEKDIKMQRRPILSNFFMGLDMYHAIYTEDSYMQIPLAIFVPSEYVRYNTYKYFDTIKSKLNISNIKYNDSSKI